MGRAHRADLDARRSSTASTASCARGPRGDGVRGDAAVDSRPRHAGRLLVLAAGSQRRHARLPQPATSRSSSRRRASGRSWPASRRSSRAAVPQIYADVDRDKVLKQGVALGDVYQTMQAFLGGLFVNQFNRFGRQWRVFLQAEGAERTSAGSDRAVLRAQQRRRDGAAVDARDDQAGVRAAVHEPLQRLSRRADHRRRRRRATARARRSTRSRRSRAQTLPRDIGYDWSDLSYQEKKRRRLGRAVRAVDRVRLPDPGGALRELVAAVLRAARRCRSRCSARSSACCCAATTSTSTRRSASSC